jgi:hypothetical protein
MQIFTANHMASAPLSHRMSAHFSNGTKIKDLTHLLFILLKEFANLFEVFKNFYALFIMKY